jgi:hypothetical protein
MDQLLTSGRLPQVLLHMGVLNGSDPHTCCPKFRIVWLPLTGYTEACDMRHGHCDHEFATSALHRVANRTSNMLPARCTTCYRFPMVNYPLDQTVDHTCAPNLFTRTCSPRAMASASSHMTIPKLQNKSNRSRANVITNKRKPDFTHRRFFGFGGGIVEACPRLVY